MRTITRLLLAACILLVLATTARAQEAKPATVVIVYDGEAWEPGRPLAICVQTGLRQQSVVGAHRIEYRFAHRSYERNEGRSTLPELQIAWVEGNKETALEQFLKTFDVDSSVADQPMTDA